MEREIKVRVWDKEKRMMHDSIQNSDESDLWYSFRCVSVGDVLTGSNFSAMLSTGLIDRNGKEIYEDDIVDDGCGKVFLVEQVVPLRQSMHYSYANYDDFISNSDINYSVVGNIYENPELLKD